MLEALELWASFLLPGAARLLPSSLAASGVPASPRQGGDGKGKDRGVDEELGESCSAPAVQGVA